jgi:hypothetical protein
MEPSKDLRNPVRRADRTEKPEFKIFLSPDRTLTKSLLLRAQYVPVRVFPKRTESRHCRIFDKPAISG